MKIRTADIDTRYYCTESKRPTKRTLLLLHGNGGSHRSFDGVIDRLSEHCRVIAPDARGQGRTPRGTAEFTYPQLGRDAIELIRGLGLDRPDIIGYSDGGIVALEAAAHMPENVGRIVTLGANFSADGVGEEFSAGCRNYLLRSKKFARLPCVKKKRELLRLMIDPDRYGAWETLKNISTDVLLMAGDADVIPLTHTRRIEESIPNAQVSIVPRCGHRIMREAPEEFFLRVENFLGVSEQD